MAITLADCKKIIVRYTRDDSVAIGYQIVPLSDSPIGFLGDHFRLSITYQNTQKRLVVANFFLKTVPRGNADFTEYVQDMGVFRKEATIYRQILSDFQKYHSQPISAKCYLSNSERFLVLEDLSKRGYRMVQCMSHEHMVQLMKTLARFHSSSIIYEEQRTLPGKAYRLIEHYPVELQETTFNPIEGKPRYKWGQTTSRAVADTILRQSEQYKKISEEFVKFATADIFEYVFPSKKYRNVINHADLWKNNTLFKGSEECVIVDFQLVRYTPPALDLMTALHVNCTSQYLKENMDYLLDIYYQTIKSCLDNHDIPIEVIFKGNEFYESIKEYEIASLSEAAMFGTIIFIGKELGQKITEDEEVFNEFNYYNRSKYVMQELENNPSFEEKYSDVLNRLIACLLTRQSLNKR